MLFVKLTSAPRDGSPSVDFWLNLDRVTELGHTRTSDGTLLQGSYLHVPEADPGTAYVRETPEQILALAEDQIARRVAPMGARTTEMLQALTQRIRPQGTP